MQGYEAAVYNRTMAGDPNRNVHAGVLQVYPGLYIGATQDYLEAQAGER